MKDIRGLFIKANREKLGYSLEALSNGICSPSYLSKIEHDELKASEDIYILLLNKLNIDYHFSEHLEHERYLLDKFFEFYLSSDIQCKKYALKLEKKEDMLQKSDLFLYYQIYKLFWQDNRKDDSLMNLDDYIMYMSSEERFLYQLHKGLLNGEGMDDIVVNENIQTLLLKSKGNQLLKQGFYIEAYDMYTHAFQMASQNGQVSAMSDVSLDLGYVCSFFDYQAMEKYYQRAINLLNDNNDTKAIAYYNMGSIYLTDKKKWDDAFVYLSEGAKVCRDKNLQEKNINNLFVYYCLIRNNNEKNKQFHLISMEDKNYALFTLMCDDNYDFNEVYSKEIKNLYLKHKNNRLFAFLYNRNCIANRKYKSLFGEEIKNKY